CLVQTCGQDRRFAHSVLRTRGDCSSGWRQSRSTPGLGPLEEREGFWRIECRTTAVHGAPFPPMERARLQPLPRVLRVLLHARRLRRLQVDLPTSDPRRSGGVGGCGLFDVFVAAARELPLPLQPGAWRRRAGAWVLAPRLRRER